MNDPVLAARLCRIVCYAPKERLFVMLHSLERHYDNDDQWNKHITMVGRMPMEQIHVLATKYAVIPHGVLKGVRQVDLFCLPSDQDVMAVGILGFEESSVWVTHLPTQCGSGWAEDAWFQMKPFPFVAYRDDNYKEMEAKSKRSRPRPAVHAGFLDMYTRPGLGTGQMSVLDYWCQSLCLGTWLSSRGEQAEEEVSFLVRAPDSKETTTTRRTFSVYSHGLLYSLLQFRSMACKRMARHRLGCKVKYCVMGMSLGAALGAISCLFPISRSLHVDTFLIGFGSPGFGNESLYALIRDQVTSIQWFANVDDPVPIVLQKMDSRYPPFVSLTKADSKRKNRSHQFYQGVDFFCSQQALVSFLRYSVPKEKEECGL